MVGGQGDQGRGWGGEAESGDVGRRTADGGSGAAVRGGNKSLEGKVAGQPSGRNKPRDWRWLSQAKPGVQGGPAETQSGCLWVEAASAQAGLLLGSPKHAAVSEQDPSRLLAACTHPGGLSQPGLQAVSMWGRGGVGEVQGLGSLPFSHSGARGGLPLLCCMHSKPGPFPQITHGQKSRSSAMLVFLSLYC